MSEGLTGKRVRACEPCASGERVATAWETLSRLLLRERGFSPPHPNRCLTERMRKGGHWAKTGGIRVRGQAWTGARGGGLRPSLQTPL